MTEQKTDHNERRLMLNLSDRQVIEVLALAGEMCLTNYFGMYATNEAEHVIVPTDLDAALRNAGVEVRAEGRVGDATVEPILRAAERMHGQGDHTEIAERMLDVIGGIELAENGSRRFWNVPNVYAVAVEDTRHWLNVPDWIKDLGPFWTFTAYLVDDNRVDHCCSMSGSQFMWAADMEVVFWDELLRFMRPHSEYDDRMAEKRTKAREWFEEHRCTIEEDSHYRADGVVDEVKSSLIKHVGSPNTAWSNLDGETNDEKYSKWMDEMACQYWANDFRLDQHILDCMLLECQELPGGPGMFWRDPEIEHRTHLN